MRHLEPCGRTRYPSRRATWRLRRAHFRSADYINGEMLVQDGGAYLRSSGAEDLLQWTDAQ